MQSISATQAFYKLFKMPSYESNIPLETGYANMLPEGECGAVGIY